MKENKNIEDRVMDVLKHTEPQLNDPVELRNSIIDRIKEVPQSSRNNKRLKRLHKAGWISGIAAALLICLFISETLSYPSLKPETTERVEYSSATPVLKEEQRVSLSSNMTPDEKKQALQTIGEVQREFRSKRNLRLQRISNFNL